MYVLKKFLNFGRNLRLYVRNYIRKEKGYFTGFEAEATDGQNCGFGVRMSMWRKTQK